MFLPKEDIGYVSFWDFRGGSMIELMSMMEYAQSSGRAQGLISPLPNGSVQIFINFPSSWQMLILMVQKG